MKRRKSFFIYLIDVIWLIAFAAILLVITYFKRMLCKPIDIFKTMMDN
ncbi:hypothetical protein [Haloimpatiens massiliensis]|nr:hypothetical protein [Haloimpatiens massiliensis]